MGYNLQDNSCKRSHAPGDKIKKKRENITHTEPKFEISLLTELQLSFTSLEKGDIHKSPAPPVSSKVLSLELCGNTHINEVQIVTDWSMTEHQTCCGKDHGVHQG